MNKLTIALISLAAICAAAGVLLFGLKYAPANSSVSVDSPLGGNMALFTSVQKTDICALTTNTTTACSLLNDDQDLGARYIDSAVLFMTFSSSSFDFAVGTSTAQISATTSSQAMWNPTTFTYATAASIPQRLTTSSYPTVAHRVWGYGEYLQVHISTVTTTAGFFKVVYDKKP